MYAIHPLAVWHEGGFSNTWKMDRDSITGEEDDDDNDEGGRTTWCCDLMEHRSWLLVNINITITDVEVYCEFKALNLKSVKDPGILMEPAKKQRKNIIWFL